jgi:regulatory protein
VNALITAIEPSRRREGRFELLVDGRHAATVSLDIVERLGLRPGQPFAPVAGEVEREAALLATYDRALRMLAFRARARTELRRSLVGKGEPPEQVEAALDRLAAAGLLDDAAFARQFTRSRSTAAGASRRRIRQELNRRGVAREVTDGAIDEVYEEEEIDEGEVALRAARRKLRSLAGLDPVVRNRRLYAFLARRGYDATDIRRAIETVTGEHAALEEHGED